MTIGNEHSENVWIDENAAFESIVALDDIGIFVGSPERSRIVEISEQIKTGTSPASALEGSRFKLIQFDTLHYIKSNRHTSFVQYRYKGNNGKDALDNFTIKKEQRDDLFKKLEYLCSRGFQYTETQFSRFRAALAPIITVCVVVVMTILSYQAAIQMAAGDSPDTSGRRSQVKRIFAGILEFLGPTGVLIVGGFISIICLIWLVNRIKTPPFILKYQKG